MQTFKIPEISYIATLADRLGEDVRLLRKAISPEYLDKMRLAEEKHPIEKIDAFARKWVNLAKEEELNTQIRMTRERLGDLKEFACNGTELASRVSPELEQWSNGWRGQKNAVLSGETEIGKTTSAASAVLRVAIENNSQSIAGIAVRNLGALYAFGQVQITNDLYQRLASVRWLLLDDLAKEAGTSYLVLQHLVFDRSDKHLCTVTTTGLKQQELRESYSDSFLRRLIGAYERGDFIGQ